MADTCQLPLSEVECDDLPQILLRYLTASSRTFQQLAGVNNLESALTFTELPLAEKEPKTAQAIITDGPLRRTHKVGTAVYEQSGNLYWTLRLIIPEECCCEEDQYAWFMRQMGKIRSEMLDHAGRGHAFEGIAHLNVIDMSSVEGPEQEHDAEREHEKGEYNGPLPPLWWMVWLIEWF